MERLTFGQIIDRFAKISDDITISSKRKLYVEFKLPPEFPREIAWESHIMNFDRTTWQPIEDDPDYFEDRVQVKINDDGQIKFIMWVADNTQLSVFVERTLPALRMIYSDLDSKF